MQTPSPLRHIALEGSLPALTAPVILLWDDCAGLDVTPVLKTEILSAAEQERHRAMTHAGNGALFLAGRVLLRSVLAQQAGCEPGALDIAVGQNGKPFLASPECPLHFNLSHSKQSVVLALSGDSEVGVDLEDRARHADAQALVSRFCTPLEQQWFATLPAAHQQHAFFTLWSLKEACLKAWGSGIAKGFDRFSVLPDEQRIIVHDAQLSTPHTAISVWYTSALPGRTLAIAQIGSAQTAPLLYQVAIVQSEVERRVLRLQPRQLTWVLLKN